MGRMIFDFENPVNTTVSGAEVTGGLGKLLANEISALKTKVSDFADADDYTFDTTKVSVASGTSKLKDQRPDGATFHAGYAIDGSLNASWGGGSLTGTGFGGAVGADVSDGKVALVGHKYIEYATPSNLTTGSVGSIVYKIAPQYTGVPATHSAHFHATSVESLTPGDMHVVHFPSTGTILWMARTDTGTVILNATLPAWLPVAGQVYTFQFDWDFINGVSTLRIDGVQHGPTLTGTGTRSAPGFFMIGTEAAKSLDANFDLHSFTVFNAPQAAVIGTVTDTIYLKTNPYIDLDDNAVSEALGLSSIESLTEEKSILGSDDIKYAVSVDGFTSTIYHNGSAWVSSSSYTQTNTLAQILANAATLNLSNNTFGLRAYLHSENGDTTPELDTVTIEYKSLQYRTAGGTILTNDSFNAQELEDFEAATVVPSGDTVKFGLHVNGATRYHNGSSWVVSNGTNAQLNTFAEILANLATALTVNSKVQLFIRLTSGDGTTTPSIEEAAFDFNFGGPESTRAETCFVYGYMSDATGTPIQGATVTVELDVTPGEYAEASGHIVAGKVFATSNADGYFQITLIRSSQFESGPKKYKFKIEKALSFSIKDKIITVPDAESVDITEQLFAAT